MHGGKLCGQILNKRGLKGACRGEKWSNKIKFISFSVLKISLFSVSIFIRAAYAFLDRKFVGIFRIFKLFLGYQQTRVWLFNNLHYSTQLFFNYFNIGCSEMSYVQDNLKGQCHKIFDHFLYKNIRPGPHMNGQKRFHERYSRKFANKRMPAQSLTTLTLSL